MSNEWPNEKAEPRATDVDALLEKENRLNNVPKEFTKMELPDVSWIDPFKKEGSTISANKIRPEVLPEDARVSRTAQFFATIIAVGIFTLSSLLVIGLIIAVIMWIVSMF